MIRAGLPELGQRVGDIREGRLVRQPSEVRRDRGSHAGRFAGRDGLDRVWMVDPDDLQRCE
jgi:hypothetical protein